MGYRKEDAYSALKKFDMVDELYERLRIMVTSGILKPGERINKIKLCEIFQVSRPPLREALQRLIAKGLVNKIPQRGCYVVSLEDKDVHDIYDLRENVETLAIKDSIKKIPEDRLLSLKKFFINEDKKYNENPEYVTSEEYIERDMELHFDLIINYSESMILKHIGSNLFDFAELTSHVSQDPGSSIKEHIEIIYALLDQNESKAIEALKEHFCNMKKFIVSELAK